MCNCLVDVDECLVVKFLPLRLLLYSVLHNKLMASKCGLSFRPSCISFEVLPRSQLCESQVLKIFSAKQLSRVFVCVPGGILFRENILNIPPGRNIDLLGRNTSFCHITGTNSYTNLTDTIKEKLFIKHPFF